MKYVITLILLYLFAQSTFGQKVQFYDTLITTIHPIDKVRDHYAELQTLSNKERSQYSWMDTVSYPPELYKSSSIRLALATPKYLTHEQVKYLVRSAQFPANSSEQTRAELDYLLTLQENRTQKQVERVMALAEIGYWPDINYLPTKLRYEKKSGTLIL